MNKKEKKLIEKRMGKAFYADVVKLEQELDAAKERIRSLEDQLEISRNREARNDCI